VRRGVPITFAPRHGYELSDSIVDGAAQVARYGATIRLVRDPVEAVTGADAVYTDVWTSMGQEAETQQRLEAFRGYQVTTDLMRYNSSGLLLHCIPAHRG